MEIIRGVYEGVLPDFIIVGAQKGGTSSLYQYLLQHPQVIGATTKEIHFFDYQFEKGVKWYRAHFPTWLRMRAQAFISGEYAITGEASPYYLFHPHAPRRIAEVLPDIRLIVLLRDPVERAYSHYHHMARMGAEFLDFEEAIEKEEERLEGERARILDDASYRSYDYQYFSYLSRGNYLDQLRMYHRYFSQQQMLVLKSEQFFAETQKVFDQVTKFLGLKRWTLRGLGPRNAGSYSPISPSVRKCLQEYFSYQNGQLYNYVGFNFNEASD